MSESGTSRDGIDQPPDESSGDYRFWFPLQPETVIEAAEYLNESDDAYEQYLAAELADAYDRCPDDLSDYRDVRSVDTDTEQSGR